MRRKGRRGDSTRGESVRWSKVVRNRRVGRNGRVTREGGRTEGGGVGAWSIEGLGGCCHSVPVSRIVIQYTP